MNQDFAQRRRVAVAAAITVIAVPAAVLLNRGDDAPASEPPVTVIGTVVGVDDGSATDPAGAEVATETSGPAATDAMGTTPVAYLDGTVPSRADDPATIAIPRVPPSVTGTASFSRSIPAPERCQAMGVPFNATLTVTNLDNSRSVQCIASIGGATPADDIVLHDEAFMQIADLTDAPVPVLITW